MNLEPIDTSTTAGKAEVMRLAAEGRMVSQRYIGETRYADISDPKWDWVLMDYAIIAEAVGPKEIFVNVYSGPMTESYEHAEGAVKYATSTALAVAVRYLRADLAGEVS